MSHFNVAVLSHSPEDVEELLAPFCEDPSSDDYLEIVPANESIEEIRAQYEQKRKNGEDFASFVSRYYGYTYNEELNECGYLCNPNAKWDWYEIGGRWSDMLRLKPSIKGDHGKRRTCNQARLRDVDLSIDQAAHDQAIRFWEVVVEGDALREHENAETFQTFYRKEYYINRFGDKQAFAMDTTSFSVWAFVSPDGEWHEIGEMGWFSMHNATRESRRTFADELKAALEADPDLWLTIVDCHI